MSGIATKVAKDRIVAQGLGTNTKPLKYLNQDYGQLKAQCLASNSLFEDEPFPASQASLGVKELGPDSDKTKGIVWLRPMQIHPKPEFIISGATRSDIRQGSLGDCWFLSSIASLTLNEEYLSQVVPGDQSFQTNYAGIFHFKFWQYGEWVDVVVDDRLPTKKGKLVFVKSAEGNEFWSALLEKAYAKLNGSYEALIGGSPVDALEDFTGGIAELYYLEKPPADLFQRVQKVLRANSLLTCSSKSDSGKVETVAKNNVVKNHAYTITRAEEVSYRGEKVQLIRLRNPWGKTEWNGAWSDNAPEWDDIDSETRAALNTQGDDGEVWMPFSDFISEFYRLDICNLSLDCVCSKEERRWCLTQFYGSWKSGCTAGGCKKYPDTFWINPQFRIKLEEPDDEQGGAGNAQSCTVIVALIQKNRRKMKPTGGEEFAVGYYLYPIPKELQGSPDVPLGKDFFLKTKYVAWTDVYKKHRETCCRHKLPVGEYVLLPHTYYPCQEADFCLRVFSEKKVGVWELGDVANADLYQLDVSDIQVESEIGDILTELEQQKMEMSAEELRINLSRILSKRKDIKSDGFSLATCKEIINLFDTDLTGKLSYKEFRPLWIKLDKYTKIFKSADNDRSESIEAHEMRNALQQAGFNLNNKIQEAIVQRYITNGLSISFDSFIACLIRLETLFKMFELLKTNESGALSLSLSEEINPNAEFITDGATRFDICQSTIADCGFLSTIGCATLSEEYLSLVLPQDQNFKTNYAGIFHFKFWQRGEWLDVVVDDKLPTRDKKLVFVKSAEENEFWPALLEKAFAKLRGSYEALEYQYSTVALQHFTGGVCLWYFLKKHQFPKIQRAVKSKCLLTSSTGAFTHDKNLVAAHSYSITGAEEVSYKGEKVQLVRLRNPWGYKEWTGAWSDNAPEWNDVAQEVKDALLTQKDDGEFWIPFLDMVKDYESLDICHIAPSKEVNVEEPHWSLMQTEGSWKKGDSAERFLADPQFRIKLEVPDDDDDQDAAEDKALCTVIVALMSKEILEKVPDFLLYQLPKEVPTNLLVKDLKAMARERVNNRNKEYVGCFQVQKGEYAVIPNPSDPNQDFDFYIRVYYRKKGGSLEKDGEVTNTSE